MGNQNNQPRPQLDEYWENWLDGQIECIKDAFAHAKRITDLIEELQVKLGQIMEMAQSEAAFTLTEIKEDPYSQEDPTALLTVATMLYWEFDDKYVRRGLAEGLNISTNRLPHLLYRIPATTKCSRCGSDLELYINSRSSLAPSYHYCVKCQALRDEESRIRNEAMGQTEEQRKTEISLLRAMPYGEYLKTDHWQGIRTAAIKRAHFRCQICNAAKPLHVHHRTYERRGHELANDVIALCADCHKTFHENGRVNRD